MTLRPLLAAALLAPAAAHAQARATPPAVPPLPAPRAEVRFDSTGVARTRITGSAYEHVPLFENETRRDLLLLKETTAEWRNDREGTDGQVRVRAYAAAGGRFSRLLWTVDAPGTRAVTDLDAFLRVTQPGCCASVPTHAWYALGTGRAVTRFTAEPLLVPGDDPGREVVAVYHAAAGSITPAELQPREEAAGVLRLVSGGRVVDRLVVSGRELGDDARLSLAIPAVGEESGPPSQVELRFVGGETVRVPVRAGRFVAQGAVLPRGVRLERRTGS